MVSMCRVDMNKRLRYLRGLTTISCIPNQLIALRQLLSCGILHLLQCILEELVLTTKVDDLVFETLVRCRRDTRHGTFQLDGGSFGWD